MQFPRKPSFDPLLDEVYTVQLTCILHIQKSRDLGLIIQLA